MIEYPKHVYPGGDLTKPSRIVKNAAEEAAALAEGYELIERSFPEDVSPAAAALGSAFIEYPKHLYPDGDIEKPSRVVRNAEEEHAACAEGFAPLSTGAPGTAEGGAGAEASKPRTKHPKR